PYTDDKTKTGLMALMVNAGGVFPNGTTISGNYLGIDSSNNDGSKITVTHVFANTPSAQAGFKTGDQIVAINGKSFKNDEDFEKRLNKVNDPTYAITVVRDGQSQTFTVQRRARPAMGTPENDA